MHLVKKKQEKKPKQILYLGHQIKKADLEIVKILICLHLTALADVDGALISKVIVTCLSNGSAHSGLINRLPEVFTWI